MIETKGQHLLFQGGWRHAFPEIFDLQMFQKLSNLIPELEIMVGHRTISDQITDNVQMTNDQRSDNVRRKIIIKNTESHKAT